MTTWFRVYGNLVDDPKFIKLGPDLRSALLMTWCVASKNGGKLPSLEDVAIKFRLSLARTRKLLDELERCGFIDRNETDLSPHNWNARQFKSDVSTERVKRFRKRHETVSETPPDTESTETENTESTETEKKEDTANAVSSPTKYAFESGVIRLSEKDFRQWGASFSFLDLSAELLSLSEWAATQPKWFHAVSGALAKRNRELGLRLKIGKENSNGLETDRDRRKRESREALAELRAFGEGRKDGDFSGSPVRLLSRTGTGSGT